MKYLCLLFALLSLSATHARHLTGRITDTVNQPVVGATVVVSDSLYYDICISDAQGQFQFRDCPTG